MKTFKKILIGLLIFVALVAVVGLLIPGETHIERSTEIKAPAEKVFGLVANMRSWNQWSPWHKIDPNMKIEYFGPETGVGAGYKWTSEEKNVGNGKMTVTGFEPNTRIDTEMDFMENGTAKASFLFAPAADGTKLTWTMDSDMKQGGFPMNVLGGYFKMVFKGMIEKDYDKGLANLKAEAEKI